MAAKRHNGVSICWRLDGTCATLVCGALRGAIDVQRPHRGLSDLRFEDQELRGRLLCVALGAAGDQPVAGQGEAWQPADAYVRGGDLIATYREPAGQPFNLQVYWRVVNAEPQEPVSLEAIVSVQTPLWESYPAIVAGSSLAGELEQLQDAAIIRLPMGASYVEHSLAGDFELASAATTDDGLQATHWRFGPLFMEKGVIRQLRLRGAIVARAGDVAAAEQLRAALGEELPPLTT